MRVKIPEGKMVVQCPDCLVVGIKKEDGKMHRQASIVVFQHLPKKRCMTCRAYENKNRTTADTQ